MNLLEQDSHYAHFTEEEAEVSRNHLAHSSYVRAMGHWV